MKEKMNWLIEKIHGTYIWNDMPVFCFTSDIDWASEAVMYEYFRIINAHEIKPTLFVTHESPLIESNFQSGNVERGIHPNFLPNSSHGNSFREIIETCIHFAPEAYGFRSHRAFEVTDITHLLKNDFGYKYVSHQISIFQPNVIPILHESGLINFPVFFEDGTHLYNKLELNIQEYLHYFTKPGIKVISFHPMNFIFNSPSLSYMRNIKDTLTRDEYQNISQFSIKQLRNKDLGIRDTVIDIINFVKQNNYPIMSMNEIYQYLIGNKL